MNGIDDIKEGFLEYRDAMEDLLIRQLIFSEEPLGTKELALRTHLTSVEVSKKLSQSRDAELGKDEKWRIRIDEY